MSARRKAQATPQPPAASLPLDQVVVTATRTRPYSAPFTIAGKDLARLVGYAEQRGSIGAVVDNGHVNLMLRGLAELLHGHDENDCRLGTAAAFFVAQALEDLAARLEVGDEADGYVLGIPTGAEFTGSPLAAVPRAGVAGT